MTESKLTPNEEITVRSYDQHAKAWSEEHMTPGFWRYEMDSFQRHLPKGRVLEIGSGGGRDAKELIARGYDYTGTDLSSGLIEQAQLNNPGARFVHRSVYQLDQEFPPRSFEGFWASASLLHIPKGRILEALDQIHRVVTPNGIGFISVKQGEGEKLITETEGDREYNRLFSFYTLYEFKKYLREGGFELIYSSVRPVSAKTTWLEFFTRRGN